KIGAVSMRPAVCSSDDPKFTRDSLCLWDFEPNGRRGRASISRTAPAAQVDGDQELRLRSADGATAVASVVGSCLSVAGVSVVGAASAGLVFLIPAAGCLRNCPVTTRTAMTMAGTIHPEPARTRVSAGSGLEAPASMSKIISIPAEPLRPA